LSLERKLAAILAADVVAYSRLMGEDEAGTLAALKTHRKELIDPRIAEHRGRIVKTTGDGMLVEFPSVVDAVACAVEIQSAMARRSADVSDQRRMQFRVGINLGDIIVEGDDIYGDGVNIAARLESLAPPGGICVSRNVYEQVASKLDLPFEDLGERQVKNIAQPIRVYQIRPGNETGRGWRAASRSRRRVAMRAFAIGGGAAILVLVAAWVAFLAPGRDRSPNAPSPAAVATSAPSSPASVEPVALALPSKPSIAVLPFNNMSADPEQEYFSDGMTEDLITDLSRDTRLFVIARNSTFTYKGRAVNVADIGRQLGVRYVLEGSVRRSGNRVRVTAQLIDAASGAHVWADRFDRDLTDIFVVQDELTQKIVGQLVTSIVAPASRPASSPAARQETMNLAAYDFLLRARQHVARFTEEDSGTARELLGKAIALDPNYARAHALLGWLYYDEWRIWGRGLDENMGRALDLGLKAAALDDTLAAAHILIAQVHQYRRAHDQAEVETGKAIALQPTDADTLAALGYYLRLAGRPDEAIGYFETAMRLDPFYPPWYDSWLGGAYQLAGRYDDAIRIVRKLIDKSPDYLPAHLTLVATYMLSGREAEARAEAAEVMRLNPDFTLEGWQSVMPFKNQTVVDQHLAVYRKAGLR